jgi:hypothetical protein
MVDPEIGWDLGPEPAPDGSPLPDRNRTTGTDESAPGSLVVTDTIARSHNFRRRPEVWL